MVLLLINLLFSVTAKVSAFVFQKLIQDECMRIEERVYVFQTVNR